MLCGSSPPGPLAAATAAATDAGESAASLLQELSVRGFSRPDLVGVADIIKTGKARRIVVMAGAGISVSAGIPDFRSPGTGLYSQLQRYNLPWPEAVFDIQYFRHNPQPFCMLAKELWPAVDKHAPTATHHFLRLLHDKGLLATVFSQNIDGLEQIAGLPADKVVNAHGSFDSAHCIDCKQGVSIYAVQAAVYDDQVPTCSSCGGLVKPDITFFGEPLPARFHRRRLSDLAQADLLLVLGTSLLVQPFAGMIDAVPDSTPRVLINLTRAGERKQQEPQQQECTTPDPEQQQQQQQQARGCGVFCRLKRRHAANSNDSSSDGSISDSSSDSSSSDSSSSDSSGSESDEDCGGGSESACPALTASSSAVDMSDSCCCSSAANDSISSPAAASGAAVCKGSAAIPGGSSSTGNSSRSGGFDFEGFGRDVLHLGDCDSAVQQLAALLGWQQELQQLVEAGDAAFREAQDCW